VKSETLLKRLIVNNTFQTEVLITLKLNLLRAKPLLGDSVLKRGRLNMKKRPLLFQVQANIKLRAELLVILLIQWDLSLRNLKKSHLFQVPTFITQV
jgi:hypothetical protein